MPCSPSAPIPADSKQPVHVLIPAHNRRSVTLECLNALNAAGDLGRYHVVVIDDGSTDGTAEAIRLSYPQIHVLTGDGNLWWTGAIVLGMRHAVEAGAEQLIWLNDDCLVRPRTLELLVEHTREHPRTIIGAQGVEANVSTEVAFGGKRRSWRGFRFVRAAADEVAACDVLSGNLVCMPREVVDAIGYPDLKATPHYGGDALYMVRARNAGYRLFVDGRTEVVGVSGERPLFPTGMLTAPGGPLRLLELTFQPRSGLAWRMWLHLYWEAYGVWGLVMWSKRQAEVVGATALRFLPLRLRRRLAGH